MHVAKGTYFPLSIWLRVSLQEKILSQITRYNIPLVCCPVLHTVHMWDTVVDKYLWLFKKESIWLEAAMTCVLLGNWHLCNLLERKSAELLARLTQVSNHGGGKQKAGKPWLVQPHGDALTQNKDNWEGRWERGSYQGCQLQAELSILEGSGKVLRRFEDDSHH